MMDILFSGYASSFEPLTAFRKKRLERFICMSEAGVRIRLEGPGAPDFGKAPDYVAGIAGLGKDVIEITTGQSGSNSIARLNPDADPETTVQIEGVPVLSAKVEVMDELPDKQNGTDAFDIARLPSVYSVRQARQQASHNRPSANIRDRVLLQPGDTLNSDTLKADCRELEWFLVIRNTIPKRLQHLVNAIYPNELLRIQTQQGCLPPISLKRHQGESGVIPTPTKTIEL